MKKQKTAIDWLVNVVQSCISPNYIPKEIVKQAKEMEKEQQGYSEEDMREAIKFGLNGMYGYQFDEEGETENQIIKYLKQFKNK